MDELYITTASAGLSEKESTALCWCGGVFRYQAGVKGLNSVKYNLN